ncbi:MAG TPA: hypothetical protein VJ508_12135, partial [Saprospiraceae bacterium]|nr:hypothetical protein [Saprospiraceae bacterium]
MRLTVICCFLGLLLLEGSKTLGQGTYVPPKIPGRVQKEFDAAVLASKAGPNQEAFQTILSISQKYPTWTLPRQELSRLYYESGDKQQAIAQLEQALALDTLSQLPQLYTLARLYDEITNLEKAHAAYSGFIDKTKIDDPLRAKAKENIADLEAKQRLLTRHYDIEFHPFSDPINTTDQEALGCWTLDGQELIFTRKVNGQEDLFVAHPDSLGHWKIEPFTYNTPQNEGAHAISPDGRYLIFTSCNRPDGFGGCDMYISINRKGIWSRPVNMGKGFNTSSWDGQPTFGMEGQIIFFSSNREGGFGGRDIWYMYQLYGDSWSNPENAGP